MPYDGLGQFLALPPPAFPAIAGTTILSADYNAVIRDVLDGLSNAVTRDGQSVMTGDLDFGTNGIRNLAPGIASGDAVTFEQIVLSSSPLRLGATGDGVADDTDKLQSMLNSAKALDLRGRRWKVTAPLDVPENSIIDWRGGEIVAATGSSPIFRFTGAKEGLFILGGRVSGTFGAILRAEGTSLTPTDESQYARGIHIYGLRAKSSTGTLWLDLYSTRQVYLDGCQIVTASGISLTGKCVEIHCGKSVIYSSTGAAGTYGLKLRSAGGSSYYHEGVHFTDCTIGNFSQQIDGTDVFVFSFTGGYIDGVASGKAVLFGQPTTNLCSDIKFVGTSIAGQVEFAPTGGRDYAAVFEGCSSLLGTGTNIKLSNNAAGISIRGHKFRSSTSGVAVEMISNNVNCSVSDVDCDSTFLGGVQIKGVDGAGCSIHGLAYRGSGEPFYVERPVSIKNVPVSTTAGAAMKQAFVNIDTIPTYAVGATIASVTTWFAKGESGIIVLTFPAYGMNASTQRLKVVVPAGILTPTATAADSKLLLPRTASGFITAQIPYSCTDDITAGVVSLVNDQGSTITADYNGYFGVVKDW